VGLACALHLDYFGLLSRPVVTIKFSSVGWKLTEVTTLLCWCLGMVAFLSLLKSRVPLFKVADPAPLKRDVLDLSS